MHQTMQLLEKWVGILPENVFGDVFRQLRLSIMSELRLNARVHAWARRSALGGTKNDSYKVIKSSRDIWRMG